MNKPMARVFVAFYYYGGNGGIAAVSPELMFWWAKTYHQLKLDPRIEFVGSKGYCDTPVTLVRNQAIEDAQGLKADMVLMLDSDNIPDGYEGFAGVKPFWETSFTFAYERLLQGIPTVIAAPYCGPPPPPVDPPGILNMGEVPYLFQWSNKESHVPYAPQKLDMLTRNEAARLAGIHPMAALPTGVCLFALKAFEGLKRPYFYYDFNEAHTEKSSTEDVVATRNIGMFWQMTKGYDVLFANCDAWAWHVKTKKVGKPTIIPSEAVAENFAEAIRNNWSKNDEVRQLDFGFEKPVVNFNLNRGPQKAIAEPPPKPNPKPQAIDPTRLKRRWDVLGPDDNEIYVSDDEYREIEAAEKMEALGIVKSMEDKIAEALPPLPASNGKPLTSRLIGRHKVRVLGEKLPDVAVENIQNLARYVSEKNGGPIKAAVIRPGTGEGTAALLSVLPDDSRVHAYNWADPSRNSEYFKEAFKKDMDMGVVKADLDGKQAPDVSEHWSDMALFQDKPDEQQLERWFANVSPRGLLCGVGYSSPDVKAVVDKFCDDYSLPVQESGGVWAVPVGDINHV